MFVRSCPVCGHQHEQVIFRPRASPGLVSKCLDCGMVYIAKIEDDHALIINGPVIPQQANPRLLTSSDLIDVKDFWEYQYITDKEAEWPALRQNAIHVLEWIESNVDKPLAERKILDFGSGWGYFLSIAKERGWIPYGLEPLPACSIYARAKFGLNITTDTLHIDTFPPNFFDVITSFQVFEHLPNPDGDLHILYNSLRLGGKILIEVPNFDTWTMQILKSQHRHFVQDHLNFFSSKSLRTLLVNNGFSVIKQYHPIRRMSFFHLTKHWFSLFLPASVVAILQNAVQKSFLSKQTVSLSIGDILTIIAQKQ